MSPKYIIANWKANQDRAGVDKFVRDIREILARSPLPDQIRLIVCPNYAHYGYLENQVNDLPFALGLQDLSPQSVGAHTGEVVAGNLAGLEPQYVILGHSERRRDQGETNQLISQKVISALEIPATPIVCFDEPELPELAGLLNSVDSNEPLLMAYEPVCAISTSGSAGNLDPQVLVQRREEFVPFWRDEWLFIYGGSVKPENAAAYASVCDGLLIGSASLGAESFVAIAREFGGAG